MWLKSTTISVLFFLTIGYFVNILRKIYGIKTTVDRSRCEFLVTILVIQLHNCLIEASYVFTYLYDFK